MDELTDGQLKFLFHADNERERMKQEKAEAERNKQQMKNQL